MSQNWPWHHELCGTGWERNYLVGRQQLHNHSEPVLQDDYSRMLGEGVVSRWSRDSNYSFSMVKDILIFSYFLRFVTGAI